MPLLTPRGVSRAFPLTAAVLALVLVLGSSSTTSADRQRSDSPTVSRAVALQPTYHPAVRPRVAEMTSAELGATPVPVSVSDAVRRPASGHPQSPPPASSNPCPTGPGIVACFSGMDYSLQVLHFGPDQANAPPSTQLAVGPTGLFELVNASGSVWQKNGTYSTSNFVDLNTFFGVPSGYQLTDPRVLYDNQGSRWFASGRASDKSNDTQVYIATSLTSDPTKTWFVQTVVTTSQVIADQPKIGVSNDKVTIGWDDYVGASGSNWIGQETWVLDKNSLIGGNAAATAQFGPDNSRFGPVPVQSLDSSSTQYVVYNNSDRSLSENQPHPTIGVMEFTGNPSSNNVKLTEVDPSILGVGTQAPPPAAQPSPGPLIDTNDDRFTFAVLQNNLIWTGGNDSCVPAGDSSPWACARLFQINVAGTPTVVQDFDVSATNTYVYYPAAMVDQSGNLFVTLSESSSQLYPSAGFTWQAASQPPNSFATPVVYEQGQGMYNCGNFSSCVTTRGVRWGDYSGAAQDSLDPTKVWVAAEYAPSPNNPSNWGTGIAELTLPPLPSPTSTGTSTSTPTSTSTRTPTWTPSSTLTPTSTGTPTSTSTPTSTPTATATPTSTDLATVTPSDPPTISPTDPAAPSPTATDPAPSPTATDPTATATSVVWSSPTPGSISPQIYLPIVNNAASG